MMMRLNIYIKNVYVQRSLSLAAHGSSHLLHTAPSRMASGWFCRGTDLGTPLRAHWIHKVEPVACCLFLLESGHAGISGNKRPIERRMANHRLNGWLLASLSNGILPFLHSSLGLALTIQQSGHQHRETCFFPSRGGHFDYTIRIESATSIFWFFWLFTVYPRPFWAAMSRRPSL